MTRSFILSRSIIFSFSLANSISTGSLFIVGMLAGFFLFDSVIGFKALLKVWPYLIYQSIILAEINQAICCSFFKALNTVEEVFLPALLLLILKNKKMYKKIITFLSSCFLYVHLLTSVTFCNQTSQYKYSLIWLLFYQIPYCHQSLEFCC